MGSIVLLAVSGIANAYTRLDNAGQLLTTGYGQVVLMKAGLIVGLGVLGWIMRSRVISSSDMAQSTHASTCARHVASAHASVAAGYRCE